MGDLKAGEAAFVPGEMSFAEHTRRVSDIHHCVKNNLQLIISLFSLQADRIAEPQVIDMLAKMQNRVRAIAYLHEPLYCTDDFSAIDFGEYLRTFVRELHASFGVGSRVQLQLSVADLALDMADAVPLALLLNELVSNALTHAFPDKRSGTVSIALRYSDSPQEQDDSHWCSLQVTDDGVGLPTGTDSSNPGSLGLDIVRTLTRQLRGRVELHGDKGASIEILFPLTKN